MKDKGEYPTTNDVSLLMESFGYTWSNDVQVYYNERFHTINAEQARDLLKRVDNLVIKGKIEGAKSFKDHLSLRDNYFYDEDIQKELNEELENYLEFLASLSKKGGS